MINVFALALLIQAAPATTKDAMKPLQGLIGDWRCTGQPKDPKKQAWSEKASWSYRIEKDDYSLELTSADGSAWRSAVIRYDLEKKRYLLDVVTPDGKALPYAGTLREKEKQFQVEPATSAWPRERATFTLLRENRFFITFERQEAEGRDWAETSVLGCTKEGVPFVKGEVAVCIVTGGQGSMPVEYKGKTYHVCCSGCKRSFLEDPEKTIETARKEGRLKP